MVNLNQKGVFLSLFVLALTACAPQYSGKVPPKVVNGEIDLTGWDFEKDGPVKLDGDWLFAWEEFVEPASWEKLKEQMEHTAQVPARFNTLINPKEPGKRLPGLGYASYALKIKGLGAKAAGLAVTDSFSANQLYGLDSQGRLVSEPTNYGQVSSTASKELPKLWGSNLLQIKPLPGGLNEKQDLPGDKVVLMQLSSLNFADGGFLQSIELNNLQRLELKTLNEHLFQVFMVGIFFIIGLYHLILYYQRRDDKPALYFGMMCMMIGLRLLAMGVIQIVVSNNLFLFEINLKLEYITFPIVTLCASCFFYSLLKSQGLKVLVKITFILALPLCFLVIFTEPKNFPKILIIIQVHMLLTSLIAIILIAAQSINGNLLSRALFGSFALITFGVTNDILHANGIITTALIAEITTIAFVLLQSAIISYNNAKAYQQAEYLSEKLGEEVKLQTEKLNRVQFLSQQIQNQASLDKIEQNLRLTLRNEFGVENYIFYVMNSAKDKLVPYSISFDTKAYQPVVDKLRLLPLDILHTDSTYRKVIARKKSLFLSRLKDVQTEGMEDESRKLLKMQSIFLVPLLIDSEVFAIFTISDAHKLQKNSNVIKNLTKKQRIDIEQLCQYVSPALYQALQKEKVIEAQEEALRAKNEAAINQLAAHLAHEVNNPLNYIATGKTMQQETFAKFYDKVLAVLQGDDEETRQFKAELDQLQQKFNNGTAQTSEGQDRIAKVVAEIRAITGVDGLTFQSFDIIAKIKDELEYSMDRNQLKLEHQPVNLAGLEEPILLTTNPHILARSLRTIISNCIHFSRDKNGKLAGLSIETKVEDEYFLVLIGCQPHNLKAEELENLFDLEKGRAFGTEQIGLGMIKELLHKVHCDLTLTARDSHKDEIVFKVLVPMDEEKKLQKQGKMSA